MILGLFAMGIFQPARAGVEIGGKKQLELAAPPVDVAVANSGRWIFVLAEGGKLLIYSGNGDLEGSIGLGGSFDCINVGPTDESILLTNRKENRIEVVTLSFIRKIDTEGSPYLGSCDAPVEITVFSEFECPHCAKLAPVLHEVFEKHHGKVKLVYKNYPLKSHRSAVSAAAAALAADRQGKFWPFHDLLYKDYNRLNNLRIQEIAAEVGLDIEAFRKDVLDPQIMSKIQKDIEDGAKIGVRGVPAVYINGRFQADRSLKGLSDSVEKELDKAKKTSRQEGE